MSKLNQKEQEAADMIILLIEQVQVKMITDENYYNDAVESLTAKGLLPEFDKLQQAKTEALKILKL